MPIELKYLPLSEFKLSDAGNGRLEGYLSSFNQVDAYKDTIVPGAYRETIPGFLKDGFWAWSHNWDAFPIGTPEIAKEDDHGLWTVVEFHSDPDAQRARTIVKERLDRGKSVGLSIGYIAKDYDYIDGGIRRLKAIDLMEGSIVMKPADPSAVVSNVKAHKGIYVDEAPEGSFEDLSEDVAEAFAPAFPTLARDGAYVCTLATFAGYAYVSVAQYDLDSDGPRYYRVEYTLDDMGDPVLANPTAVEPQVVFQSIEQPGLQFSGQSERALAAVRGWATRAQALVAVRTKAGRVLSAANHAKLTAVHDGMAAHLAAMQQVLKDHAPPPAAKAADVVDEAVRAERQRLWLTYLQTEARLNGVAV